MIRSFSTILVACATIGSSAFAASDWSIAKGNTLMWEGKPYLPVGMRIASTAQAIEAADAKGFKDVLMDISFSTPDWQNLISTLESHHMRYVLSINSMCPGANGIAVEPESYRVAKISSEKNVFIPLPSCDYAWGALVDPRDTNIVWQRRLSVKNETLRETVGSESSAQQLFLVYPHFTNYGFPDFWEKFDSYRDSLLKVMRDTKFGVGFRGVLNPLGNIANFPSSDRYFVPTSRVFQIEMEAFLRAKYTTVITALRSWQISAPDFDSFSVLARLVPLWSKTRGIPRLWDPITDKVYTTEPKRSTAWKDINEVISQTSTKRFSRLVDLVQSTLHVPVIQEWKGWTGPYQNNTSNLSGIGVNCTGDTQDSMLSDVFRSASNAAQKKSAEWLIASKIEPGEPVSSEKELNALVASSAAVGVRGWYLDSTSAPIQTAWSNVAKSAANSTLDPGPIDPIFYSATSESPVVPGKIYGNRWWLPASGAGNRLDYGNDIAGIQYIGATQTTTAIWSTASPRRVKLRFAEPKSVGLQAIDRTDRAVKQIKGGLIEVTLTSVPILISGTEEIPAIEEITGETLTHLAAIFATASGRIENADQEALFLKDLVKGYEGNPGNVLVELRRMLMRTGVATGNFIWMEAERSRDHTFSEQNDHEGISSGAGLDLHTRISSDLSPYYAKYKFEPYVEGKHTLWIAAKIPHEQESMITAQIGDKVFRIEAPKLSEYSDGYGWYKLGDFQLLRGATELTIYVDSTVGANISLDVVLVTPNDFKPHGIAPALVVPVVPKK